MKRRLTALLLLVTLLGALLGLAGCEKEAYPPKARTLRESRVVARVGKREVNYDLYRALFSACRTQVDGGDPDVWHGEGRGEFFARIQTLIEQEYKDLFAPFEMAEACGIDPWGDEADRLVAEAVTAEIEGGVYRGITVAGYGSREAYLAALEESGFSDAAYRLYLRRGACLDLLTTYYEEIYAGATQKPTADALASFLAGEDCYRFLWVYREADSRFDQALWMEEARGVLTALPTYEERLAQVRSYGFNLSVSDLETGLFVTSATADADYRAAVEALAGMEPGDISPVLTLDGAFCLLLKMPKPTDLTDDPALFEILEKLYLDHAMYVELDRIRDGLEVRYTNAWERLKYAPIK